MSTSLTHSSELISNKHISNSASISSLPANTSPTQQAQRPLIPHSVRGLLFFTVLALIGTGLVVVKRHLAHRELVLIIAVIATQIAANIAYVVVNNTPKTNPHRTTWLALLRAADLLCCCGVVVPILWSLSALRKSADANGDDEGMLRMVVLKWC